MLRRRPAEKVLLPPVMVSFAITRQCNLRCKHCYASATDSPHQQELNTSEAKRVISEVAATGTRLLIFDGGEPLLRSDIYELVAHARAMGLYPILGTNAGLLSTDALDKLKKAGIGSISISLHAAEAKTHDSFTGREGSWARATSGIRNAALAGVPFQINTCMHHDNLAQFDAIAELVQKLGAVTLEIFDFLPVGRGKDHADLALTPGDRLDLVRRVIDHQAREERMTYRCIALPQFMAEMDRTVPMGERRRRFARSCCGAGLRYCSIFYEGTVYPCPLLQKRAGNVLETSFYEIWQGSDVFKTLRNRDKLGGQCGRCGYRDACAGARCLVYAKTGSLTKEDGYCWLTKERPPTGMLPEEASCKHCGRQQLASCEVCGMQLCEEHSFYCPVCLKPVCHPDVKDCSLKHRCWAAAEQRESTPTEGPRA